MILVSMVLIQLAETLTSQMIYQMDFVNGLGSGVGGWVLNILLTLKKLVLHLGENANVHMVLRTYMETPSSSPIGGLWLKCHYHVSLPNYREKELTEIFPQNNRFHYLYTKCIVYVIVRTLRLSELTVTSVTQKDQIPSGWSAYKEDQTLATSPVDRPVCLLMCRLSEPFVLNAYWQLPHVQRKSRWFEWVSMCALRMLCYKRRHTTVIQNTINPDS